MKNIYVLLSSCQRQLDHVYNNIEKILVNFLNVIVYMLIMLSLTAIYMYIYIIYIYVSYSSGKTTMPLRYAILN